MHTARRKKRSFTGNSARNLSSFFGDAFSQDKEIKRRRTSVLQAKFDAVFGKLSPKPQIIFRRCFFRKTRLLSRRCICILQGARNAVLQETQPRTSNHFSAMFFRKTRKMSADVQAYFKRNLTPYSGNSARTSAHFSAMFFRKTRKTSADVQAYFKRNLTQYSEKPARTSAHFSVMFFRKTRLLSRRCICIPQGARNEVLRKNSPKNQISIMSASFFFAISSISLTYLSVIF